jgi:hypothetical protein
LVARRRVTHQAALAATKGRGLKLGGSKLRQAQRCSIISNKAKAARTPTKVIASFVGCLSATIALKTQITTDNKNDDADNSHND